MTKDEANASPKDAALRLALEYVELVPDDRYNAEHIDQDALITAIKAALEAKDEPVATKNNDGVTLHLGWDDLPVGTKLYVTPPQRKPLTDEEMKTVVEQELVNYWDGEYIDTTGARDCLTKFARAIEAAHGIKGEA